MLLYVQMKHGIKSVDYYFVFYITTFFWMVGNEILFDSKSIISIGAILRAKLVQKSITIPFQLSVSNMRADTYVYIKCINVLQGI